MKKIAIILVAAIAVIAAIVGTITVRTNSENKTKEPTAEEVFRGYIKNGLGLKRFAFRQQAEGTGTKLDGYVLNDIDQKKFLVTASMECTTSYDDEPITIKATSQIENEKTYLRLDSITGNYTNSSGTVFNLKDVFKKVKGKWYSTPEEDKGVSSLLDSGIAAYNSIIIAPAYDGEKITQDIIDSRMFTYRSAEAKNGNFVYQFTSDRNAYAKFLKQSFPNLRNADLIMDSIFEDKTSLDSFLTVSATGSFVNEDLTTSNPCGSIFDAYVGETASGFAEEIMSQSKPVDYDSVKFKPVKNASPVAEMRQDMII